MFKRIPHKETIMKGNARIEDYLEKTKRRQRIYTRVIKQIKDTGIGGHYLEIGSGPGILTTRVAESNPGVKITALESSPEMVMVSRKIIAQKKLSHRISVHTGFAEDRALMESLGPFDLIYSNFSLHHWENPVKALEAMKTAIKLRGTILIADLKRVWWLWGVPSQGGFIESIRAAYLPGEIGKMINAAGITHYSIITPFPWLWQIVTVPF